MKYQVFLSLGSNMGTREEYLKKAINLLDKDLSIDVKKLSSIYETEPFGDVEQDNFLNMVIEVETSLTPEELLKSAMKIEKDLDRVRTIRWGPRTVDIDILLYGDKEVNTDDLIIPHAGIAMRAFVLVPLLEIAPEVKLPSGVYLREYLDEVKEDIPGVVLYKAELGQ